MADQNNTIFRKKGRAFFVGAVVFLVLVGAVIFFFFRGNFNFISGGQDREVLVDQNSAEMLKIYSSENLGNNVSLPSPSSWNGDENNNFLSENYKISKINFGGEFSLLADREMGVPLSIEEIKSESFFSREKDKAKLLVSWKTTRPTISRLEYFKNGMSEKKIIENNDFSTEHKVIFSDLDLASSYTYSISSRDRWGGQVSSGQFGAYTSSGFVSVFDLISKAVGDIFGWAVGNQK